ncbi:MAG: hypothetical protein R3A12_15640 [Ignavibacteria bacterium]
MYNGSVSDSTIILSDTVNTVLKTDSTLSYSNSFAATDKRGNGNYIISIKPKQQIAEFYYFNNSAEFSFATKAVLSNNTVTLYSDGKEILTGDQVTRAPQLKIDFNGSNHSKVYRIHLHLRSL